MTKDSALRFLTEDGYGPRTIANWIVDNKVRGGLKYLLVLVRLRRQHVFVCTVDGMTPGECIEVDSKRMTLDEAVKYAARNDDDNRVQHSWRMTYNRKEMSERARLSSLSRKLKKLAKEWKITFELVKRLGESRIWVRGPADVYRLSTAEPETMRDDPFGSHYVYGWEAAEKRVWAYINDMKLARHGFRLEEAQRLMGAAETDVYVAEMLDEWLSGDTASGYSLADYLADDGSFDLEILSNRVKAALPELSL